MIQSILYGNGINRLTKGMPSWDQLIEEISDVQLDNRIPNPLKYEALLMKKPYREPNQYLITSDGKRLITSDGKKLIVNGEQTEKVLKVRIAERLKTFSSNAIYKEISSFPFTHFITTNYDNTLFQSFDKEIRFTKNQSERVYSIRRNYVIDYPAGKRQYYWPMHGNIDSPSSIMLGFDHYCGSLAKIEDYVKGVYDSQGIKYESMSMRLQKGITDVLSWIDLFFVSDVHIIGLNMGYEETDLWWVLNKRRRLKRWNSDMIGNRITYYPVEKLNDDVQQLLSSFDVDVITLDDAMMNGKFLPRYKAQMAAIQARIRKYLK